jgi:small subunit ribosomal protein S6
MNHYETVFILNPVLSDVQEGNSKQIFLLQEEPQWFERGLGPKKMAYEIQNKKSGFYHLFEFNVPGEVLI